MKKRYPPAGRCIYCGSTAGSLSDEHIIPLALGGDLILPGASCVACAKRTSWIEDVSTSRRFEMFYGARVRHGLPTRRPKDRMRPVDALTITQQGAYETISIAPSDLPANFPMMNLPLPGIVLGEAPSNSVSGTFGFRTKHADVQRVAKKYANDRAVRIGTLYPTAFFQLLAKIGYSFAAAELGASFGFLPLANLILGRSDEMSFLIGGHVESATEAPYGHRLEMGFLTVDGISWPVVTVHLFGIVGLPKYLVVVGPSTSSASKSSGP